MALIAPKLQKDMSAAIESALKKAFSAEGDADPSSYKKQADAIAEGVVKVLVQALQSDAEVLPGIATAGSPAAQTTVAPGKIF